MQPRQPGIPTLPAGVLYAVAFACAGAVAGGGYLVAQRPLASWRADLERRSELIRAKLAEAPRLRREHADLKKELDDLLGRVESVGRRIPETPLEGEFLSNLSRLGAGRGVTIDDFHRGPSVETPTHSIVTINATARGPYDGLCGLIEEVAALPRITEAVELDASRGPSPREHEFRIRYALHYGLRSPVSQSGEERE